jgi:carboxylesterase type B
LVVSRAAQGLFNKALSQSGSLFNPYAFSLNLQQSIQTLITKLQLTVTSPQNLVDQLRQLPAETLVRVNAEQNLKMPRLFEEFLFVPSVDPVDSQETRIFTNSIENLITSGNINTVPYMIGFNSMESLYSIADLTVAPNQLDRFNQDPNLLIPLEWNLTPSSAEALEVISAFRNLYFGGASVITSSHFWGWTQYVSDREFIFGCDKAARLHWNQQPLYNFKFAYSGAMSVAQILWNLQQFPEAMHGDDAFYFFRINPFPVPVEPNDPALTMQQTFVKLWTNFFRYSDPTPVLDNLITVSWPRYNSNAQFMNINLPLTVGGRVLSERMDIWFNFDRRFNS